MRKLLTPLLALLFVVALAGTTTFAQKPAVASESTLVATNTIHAPVSDSIPQNVISALAVLPEADALLYINPQRILNEVVPKFMSPKELEGMHKAFEDINRNTGINPQRVEYIVMAVRFNKPTSNLQFRAPEFLVMAGGDFNAEALIVLARMAAKEKLREEKYGDKTINVMTIEPLVKEAEKNPFLKSFTEVALATLSPNTIASGSPAYLKAALDAGSGKDRISTDTLNALVRDPNALISIAGSPWTSFSKSFGMLGTEGNPRAPRCESKIGNFYAAVTMDANNLMLRGAINEDNPDTAKIVSNLLSMFLKGASSSVKDPGAQTLLKAVAIAAEGDEVTVRADMPAQVLVDMIKKQTEPKTVESTETKAPVKPTGTKRRTRRRRG